MQSLFKWVQFTLQQSKTYLCPDVPRKMFYVNSWVPLKYFEVTISLTIMISLKLHSVVINHKLDCVAFSWQKILAYVIPDDYFMHCKTLLIKVWPADGHHGPPMALYYKCKLSGPTSDLLNEIYILTTCQGNWFVPERHTELSRSQLLNFSLLFPRIWHKLAQTVYLLID